MSLFWDEDTFGREVANTPRYGKFAQGDLGDHKAESGNFYTLRTYKQ